MENRGKSKTHTKKCTRCNIEKQCKHFSPNSHSRDGLSHVCRLCAAEWIRIWNRKNQSEAKKRSAKSRQRNGAGFRARALKKDQKRRLDPKNRARIIANQKLNTAIHQGLIERPDFCFLHPKTINKKIIGHQIDYNTPLIVVWLCMSCNQRYYNGKMPEDEIIRKKINKERKRLVYKNNNKTEDG